MRTWESFTKPGAHLQEHISEAAVAQLGEHRTLRLHAFTCSGFGGPQQEEDSPAGGLPEEPSWPSDTSKDLNDNIQDAVARARAQVAFFDGHNHRVWADVMSLPCSSMLESHFRTVTQCHADCTSLAVLPPSPWQDFCTPC